MVTSDLERMLDDWAIAWSSDDTNDSERVLALLPTTVFSRTLPSAWSLAARRNVTVQDPFAVPLSWLSECAVGANGPGVQAGSATRPGFS
jgi:hypothetical protein